MRENHDPNQTAVQELAQRLLHGGFDTLSRGEQRVLRRIATRTHITRHPYQEYEETLSYGDWLADRVASFGGSWIFIVMFMAILIGWAALNSYLLLGSGWEFDPYPYIFLNLILSMLAALQAPVIMMSQNRQASKDRLAAAHDYEVNLKAELEIMALHEKLDEIRTGHLTELLKRQSEQIGLLTQVTRQLGGPGSPSANS